MRCVGISIIQEIILNKISLWGDHGTEKHLRWLLGRLDASVEIGSTLNLTFNDGGLYPASGGRCSFKEAVTQSRSESEV